LAEFDRHVTDRNRAARDAGLVSDSFSDFERVMDQAVQHSTDCSGFDSKRVCVTYLTQDLRLANHHRIERRSNAEQVSHGFFVGVAIEMCFEKTRRQVAGSVEKLRDASGAKLELLACGGAEDLDAVA